MAETTEFDQRAVIVAREYQDSKAVEAEPDGSRASEGIWRSSLDEERECFKPIVPTKTLSGLLLHYCCTMKHVASLSDVSIDKIQAVIRRLERGDGFTNVNIDEK